MTAQPLYTRDILRLASQIPFLAPFETIDGPDFKSPTCGARMRIWVGLDQAGRVTSITQAVEACAFGQASAALVGRNAIGRHEGEVRAALAGAEAWLGGEAPEPWPGFAALDPVRARSGRHGAVLLPLRALLAAIVAAG